MATMYIALEMGIGLGAWLAGLVFQDNLQVVPFIFYGTAVTCMLGLTYLFLKHPAKKKPS
jgi:predicted MFS family arabinose efflux permease